MISIKLLQEQFDLCLDFFLNLLEIGEGVPLACAYY